MARPWVAAVRPSQLDGRRLERLLWFLVEDNVDFLAENPDTPLLYESGVRYRPEDGREEWDAIPWVLENWRTKRQGSDCEDLAAWRAAELRVRGENASCTWVAYREPGKLVYHIRVRRGDGSLEDPSVLLGMRAPSA
jgi:hypothetical protein